MIRNLSALAPALAFWLLAALPSFAQSPSSPTTAPPPAASVPATTAADLQAVRDLIGLLQDDTRRAGLVEELRSLEAAMARGGAAPSPAAPASGTSDAPAGASGDAAAAGDAQSAEAEAAAPAEGEAGAETAAEAVLSEDGLISVLSSSLADTGRDLRDTVVQGDIEKRLVDAVGEIGDRAGRSFGGQTTLNFLGWALPGIAIVTGLLVLLFKNGWLRERRRLREPPKKTGLGIAAAVGRKALFGFLPVILAIGLASSWAGFFAPTFREGQLFLALFSPLFAALIVRQVGTYLLLSLGPSRGWRLISYAEKRLLPWLSALAAVAALSSMLREFPVRAAVGFNVTAVAAFLVDMALAGFTCVFVLRHRLTVRSLLVHRRTRRQKYAEDGSRGSGILDSTLRFFGDYWHILALAFILANLAARLLGLGGNDFILQSTTALAWVVAGVATLALVNALFRRAALNQKKRPSLRRALIGRYLDILHVVLQITVAVYVALQAIDVWGFDLSTWLASENGQRIVRPATSLVLIPAVIYAIWVTIDTIIEHAMSPTDSRGRARAHSGRVRTLLPLIRNLVFVVLSVIAVIAILANIGVDVTPLLAGAGVLGLAFSFGAQQLVQDVITGFFIIFEDTIAIGDTVTAGDKSGVVEGMTIRTLRLRDGNGALHSIPFSQIKALQNSSRGYGVFGITVAIAYGADADKTMDIMREVGAELQSDPRFGREMLAPIEIWGVDGFSADGVTIKGALRCLPLQQWGVGREFNRRLKKRLDAAGIEFQNAEQRLRIDGAAQRLASPANTPVSVGAVRPAE